MRGAQSICWEQTSPDQILCINVSSYRWLPLAEVMAQRQFISHPSTGRNFWVKHGCTSGKKLDSPPKGNNRILGGQTAILNPQKCLLRKAPPPTQPKSALCQPYVQDWPGAMSVLSVQTQMESMCVQVYFSESWSVSSLLPLQGH